MTSPRLPDYKNMNDNECDLLLLHYANKRQEAWILLEDVKKEYRQLEIQMQKASITLQHARKLYHQTSYTFDVHAGAVKDAKSKKKLRLVKSDNNEMD